MVEPIYQVSLSHVTGSIYIIPSYMHGFPLLRYTNLTFDFTLILMDVKRWNCALSPFTLTLPYHQPLYIRSPTFYPGESCIALVHVVYLWIAYNVYSWDKLLGTSCPRIYSSSARFRTPILMHASIPYLIATDLLSSSFIEWYSHIFTSQYLLVVWRHGATSSLKSYAWPRVMWLPSPCACNVVS